MKKVIFLVIGAMILSSQFILAQIDGNTEYNIALKSTGLVLDADGANMRNNGCTVMMHTKHQGANQLWRFVNAGGGNYFITNVGGGITLDAAGETYKNNGGKVQLWTNSGGFTQLWRVTAVGSGAYTITLAKNGKAIDAEGTTKSQNGGIVQLWDNEKNQNQIWTITPKSTPPPPVIATTPSTSPVKVVVLCQEIVCKNVYDGPVGSRDGEELFGFLRCGVSTKSRPISNTGGGVPPVSGSLTTFRRNSTHHIQLKKGQKFEINESRTFQLTGSEANNAVIVLNGDLDELDGKGFPDDVDNFLNRVPLGQTNPITEIVRMFHRDDNDKLEQFKADERITIPISSLPALGETREYVQRFASGGTDVKVYWYVMRTN